jgi:hypothetical protein
MSIKQSNKHIEDYLNYYIALSYSPKFAILLKGGWGSGKTWFIKKYYENLNQTRVKSFWNQDVSVVTKSIWNKITRKKIHKANRCLYISLNGLNSISDIDESIYQQLYPFWSSEQVKAVGTVIKSLLKGSLKIDLTNDGKDRATWNMQIPDIPKNFEYSNFKEANKRVLIFDDLERCSINIKEVLGYINSFVESQGIKVVIIADEDKIINKEPDYKRIKEKLIGKTFEISPDYKSALNDFLCQVNEKEVQKFIQNKIDFIINLFEKSECKNLRILNYIILDFERIFEKLPTKVQRESDAIQEILQLLVIFLIEISIGKLNPKDIVDIDKKLIDEFVSSQQPNSHKYIDQNSNKNTDDISLRQIFDKYGIGLLSSNEWFPNLLWWKNFFDKGIVDQELLEQIIPTSKYFQDENTPNWLKLWHYNQHSDNDFKKILNLVNSEYIDRKFEDIGIIKHVTGLFFKFSVAKIYKKEKVEILEEAKSYIDYLKSCCKLDIKYRDEMFNCYMGKGFTGSDCQEFQEFDKYIKQSQEEVRIKNMPEKANELMNIMLKDITGFRAMICVNSLRNDIEDRYYDFPIFNYLQAEKLVERILLLSNEDKHFICSCIKERYNVNGIVEQLVSELDFLRKVQELLEEESRKKFGEISGYILSELNKNFLVKAVENLEQVKNGLLTNST